MLEVHGHWQCRICNYVEPCCSGEIECLPEDLKPETPQLAEVINLHQPGRPRYSRLC